jgi:hypothetical protein
MTWPYPHTPLAQPRLFLDELVPGGVEIDSYRDLVFEQAVVAFNASTLTGVSRDRFFRRHRSQACASHEFAIFAPWRQTTRAPTG